jgi:hypothetical protein
MQKFIANAVRKNVILSASAAVLLAAAGFASATTTPATTYNYYVSPTGSDSAAGSKTAPFRTLARAAQVAKASTTI